MTAVKIDDLAPTPFFAQFLEGQPTELTPEQMKNLRGGTSMVTQAAPSDSDAAEVRPFPFGGELKLPEFSWVAPEGPYSPLWPCGPSELTPL